MLLSTIFAIATALAGSAFAQTDFGGDHVQLGLYHAKGPNQHFTSSDTLSIGPNVVATGVFLFDRVNDIKHFEWSPDTTRVPIQQCSTWLSADPQIIAIKWDLDDGAGALKPVQNPRNPVAGSVHVECKPKA